MIGVLTEELAVIIDHLRNADRYRPLNPGIGPALGFLHRPDLASLPAGRYEVEGDRVYALVSEYSTSPLAERRWEAHRRYIDLQYLVAGRERIGYSPLCRMQPEPYDETKDVLRLSGEGECLTLAPGDFMLLWPDDAHMPGVAAGEPAPVRKVVVKIRVD